MIRNSLLILFLYGTVNVVGQTEADFFRGLRDESGKLFYLELDKDADLKAFCAALPVIKPSLALRTLRICRLNSDSQFDSILTLIAFSAPTLEHLFFHGGDNNGNAFARLLRVLNESHSRIKTLEWCYQDEFFIHTKFAEKKEREANQKKNEALVALLDQNKDGLRSIENLSFEGTRLSDDFQWIANWKWPHLVSLDLSKTKTTTRYLQGIVNQGMHFPALKTLVWQDIQLDSLDLTHKKLPALREINFKTEDEADKLAASLYTTGQEFLSEIEDFQFSFKKRLGLKVQTYELPNPNTPVSTSVVLDQDLDFKYSDKSNVASTSLVDTLKIQEFLPQAKNIGHFFRYSGLHQRPARKIEKATFGGSSWFLSKPSDADSIARFFPTLALPDLTLFSPRITEMDVRHILQTLQTHKLKSVYLVSVSVSTDQIDTLRKDYPDLRISSINSIPVVESPRFFPPWLLQTGPGSPGYIPPTIKIPKVFRP